MDNGFFVGNKDNFLDKYIQASGSLGLVAKGDGCEIMIQKVRSGEEIFLEPGENSETLEFFYIIEGVIEYTEGDVKKILTSGDLFYAHHLKATTQLYSKTDVTILYLSTEPVFQYLSKSIHDLTELAREVEKKDMYTHSHIQRVREYSLKISAKLNLSTEMTENILFASLFHDLGKINVPDDILNKKSKLSDEEYEIIKRHPSDGVSLVIKTYYKKVATIIEQHHERMDGSGYPKGLKGDEILLEARIIAVSDSFDAMTTDRPYRKGMTVKKALDELKSNMYSQFDPKVVDAFEEILKEEERI